MLIKMQQDVNQRYMSAALQYAAQGRFSVSPNPMVGCVICQHGEVIASGYHEQYGGPHAEINALSQAGMNASGATMYLNLEPCCHYGKTPPCTMAIIAAGIKEVYIAMLDPNPLVAGKGVRALVEAGIKVHVGLLAEEARALNEVFIHYMHTGKPFVILKWAMSLDGQMVSHEYDSRQISQKEAQHHTHQLRACCDAILIGAKTAMLDNPRLTVRQPLPLALNAKQPWRIILLGNKHLPGNLKIFDMAEPGKTILVTSKEHDIDYYKNTLKLSQELWLLPANGDGLIDLQSLLTKLAENNISSLLVEGGRRVHDSFFAANLVDRLHVYLAPVIIGGLVRKHPLQNIKLTAMGGDYHIRADWSGDGN
jgi:diaminohydroxyphosphoribosylaminopyrimidine deaminase / 5-amino-6-(5-phosphoribosylamino)uracil reductase